MSTRQNKFRNRPRADKGNIWQRVVRSYQNRGPFKKDVATPMYEDGAESQSTEGEDEDDKFEIPYCAIFSYLLYIGIFLLIFIPCLLMWLAQPHPNPINPQDTEAAPSIAERVAKGTQTNAPIIFKESEINRHFAQE